MESESVHIETAYPVAFFATTRNTTPQNQSMGWAEICDLLKDHSQRPYRQKEDAPLFSPTRFRGTRSAANATESGLIVLDADHGLALDDALAALREMGLAAAVYTTASHGKEGKGDRFRVIVPLAASVDVETHKKVGLLVAQMIGGEEWKPDMGKLGCYNLFYLPGRYAGVENRLEVLDGAILAAEDWLALAAIISEPSSIPSKTAAAWTSLDDCPFVRPQWVDEYLGLGGNWHNGLFRFMCRVAVKARALGHDLGESELADLARDLDLRDGGHYQASGKKQRDFEAEARNALAFAGRTTPPRSPDHPTPIRFGPAALSTTASHLVSSDPRLPVPSPHPVVQPYRFEDQAFAGRDGAERDAKFDYLAQRCVALGDGYFIRSASGWERYAKGNVVAALLQQHGSSEIGVGAIKAFLKYAIVTFSGTTVVPGAGPMVSIGGRRLLNTWHETRLPGRDGAAMRRISSYV